MKALMLEEVVAAVEGTCEGGTPGSVSRVCIDSRTAAPGDLFFAIPGERFDGHAFVAAAFSAGAVAAVVREDFRFPGTDLRSEGEGFPESGDGQLLIRVDDTVAALGRLGRYYRRSVIGGAMTVVAVTGSNGKTTTKFMIGHILSGRWKGRASIKSYNNAIGVPLTLLAAEPPESFLVCEVGTNTPGEIAALARLVEPDVAVVTCVAEAHLEGFGSLAAIAEEKLSLLSHLAADGCAVMNVDQEVVRLTLERDKRLSGLKCVRFGEWAEADLRLTDVRAIGSASVPPAPGDAAGGPACGGQSGERDARGSGYGVAFTVNGRFAYRLNAPGRHNAMNALAAIGVARRFGMDHGEIAERLATFTLPAMRLQSERLGELTVINDAYNANPASLAAAVDVLREMPAAGRRILIVGDMRELGAASQKRHAAAAEHISGAGLDVVISVGEDAREITRRLEAIIPGRVETHAYGATALAKRRLISHLQPTDTILVKGSRALGLEALVERIKEWGRALTPEVTNVE